MESNERLVAVSLTTTPTDLYTVATAKKVTVTGLSLCNTGASVRVVSVLYAGKFVVKYALDAGETFGFTVGQVLYATEKLRASQDVGADVDLIASGVVEDV